jgi:hypothetical protein
MHVTTNGKIYPAKRMLTNINGYLGVGVNEFYMNLYEFIRIATTKTMGRNNRCIFILFILIFHSSSQPLASAAPYNDGGHITPPWGHWSTITGAPFFVMLKLNCG